MKKLMIMASAIMMAVAAKAGEVNTVAFNETRVDVPARVRFVKGDNYGFQVDAKDSIVARSLRCVVKNGVLRISAGNSLQPGETKYDPKKGAYYYGVNHDGEVYRNASDDDTTLITIYSPAMPKVTTSSDYVAEAVKEADNTAADKNMLTMNGK
ncbi:MAG: hypothetical protein LUC45_08940 [Paraprevotella sp.]|nr:hypothetical protein [Paraprevotella sp.]